MNYFFNRSRISQVLDINSSAILSIESDEQKATVTYQKGDLMVKEIVTLKEVIKTRQNSISDLEIINLSDSFLVKNTTKNTYNTVTPSCNGFHCECKDYEIQSEVREQPFCKHIYAVLNFLGITTNEEYLAYVAKQANQEEVEIEDNNLNKVEITQVETISFNNVQTPVQINQFTQADYKEIFNLIKQLDVQMDDLESDFDIWESRGRFYYQDDTSWA